MLVGALVGFVIGLLAVGFAIGAVVLFSGIGMGVFGTLDELESQLFRWGGIAAIALALGTGWLAGFNATRVGGYRAGLLATVVLVAVAGLGLAIFRDAATAGSVLLYTSPLPLAMLAGALMGRKRAPRQNAEVTPE